MNAGQNAAWVEWLRSMRWDYFATLAFGRDTSAGAALRAATAWLAPVPAKYGGQRKAPYAAVGVQRGPLGDRLHVHALVGGVGRHPLTATLLQGSWRRGSIDLKPYSPLKGAVEYVVRQASEIELLGDPIAWRPARRGGPPRYGAGGGGVGGSGVVGGGPDDGGPGGSCAGG